MAQSSSTQKKKSPSRSSSGNRSKGRSNSQSTTRSNSSAKSKTTSIQGRKASRKKKQPSPFVDEITLIVTVVISILLVLSNLNLGGSLSAGVNGVTFGLMGFLAYLFPFVLFICVAFGISNHGNKVAKRKIISGISIFVVLCGLLQLIADPQKQLSKIVEAYEDCAKSLSGGGLIGSAISTSLCHFVGTIGAYVVIIALLIILAMFITEFYLLTSIGRRSSRRIHEMRERHREEQEYEYEEEDYVSYEEEPEPTVLHSGVHPRRKAKTFTFQRESRKDNPEHKEEPKKEKKSSGFIPDFLIQRANPLEASTEVPFTKEEPVYESELRNKFSAKVSDDKEDSLLGFDEVVDVDDLHSETEGGGLFADPHEIPITNAFSMEPQEGPELERVPQEPVYLENEHSNNPSEVPEHKETMGTSAVPNGVETLEIHLDKEPSKKEYVFPSINLLTRPKGGNKGVSDRELKETAMKLQSTLESFGVKVTITNVSCGPAVTRYELQPEQGVKVSRITNLADDIKLNLAAADVRIEAPIPGKAAVGIEVPNKVNSMVTFRELIESDEFKTHKSDIAFAVGKDIGGQTVVTDIAKMPHLLIAGATGSGKSVCINTLIMSILYKANPEDVKLIMVDPKVVELSVYNGIPHLMIPVVTDPKKASAALNWAVAEMTDRYKRFADLGVRDIKGYNKKISSLDKNKDVNYQNMPQIVIIIDELADLMMVAPGEVEDAICRLAQMARAAGLHLIIATQRPSVNVITGLIKANIPSRIAFSVSSAIDSRTILDGSGAEKLLGKGDMLFFPSGYPKPVRIQGAFVSDKEVSSVVEFLSSQNEVKDSSAELESKITSITSDSVSTNRENELDEYFAECGRFIIEKDKASIGMLQRVFKIGFNRAARIMDQLSDAGVVGPEEGTKPRKILMSMEEFEQYIDEYV